MNIITNELNLDIYFIICFFYMLPAIFSLLTIIKQEMHLKYSKSKLQDEIFLSFLPIANIINLIGNNFERKS